ncbi:metalloprotease [Auricularia subglabra TFB-10046 SS5]|nr:metalloprotease [Auricularia subglabra TFB-10046 SS5]
MAPVASLLAFVALACGAFAGLSDAPVVGVSLPRGCGTESAPVALMAKLGETVNTTRVAKTKYFSSTIPVHWHVIRENATYAGGHLEKREIQEQMKVLNKDYLWTGLRFSLASIEWKDDANWFLSLIPNSGSNEWMKREMRKGGVNELNIYTVGFREGSAQWMGIYGYSSWPWNYETAEWDDGIVIKYSTLPGGSEENFNLGKTVVHEAGHWAGLFHTFEGGCESPGDYVWDTVPEETGATGCPIGRKTCNGTMGLDPIHNFMDYSDDACINRFTAGQIIRMREQLFKYRRILF